MVSATGFSRGQRSRDDPPVADSRSAAINAAAIRALFDGWTYHGDDLASLQGEIDSVRQVIETHPLIPALKHIVSLLRADAAWRCVRPPFVALRAEAADRLAGALIRAGFRFPEPMQEEAN